MQFRLRRIQDYADCTFYFDNNQYSQGLLNRKEAIDLLNDFRSAVEDLEWFIHVTDKG